MLKLLKLTVMLGLVAGAVFVLPFGGRTLFGRWLAARDTEDFLARTWAEMRGAPPPAAPAAPRKPRPGGPIAAADQRRAADRPLETTTDADRKALDKLLDRHLADPPRR